MNENRTIERELFLVDRGAFDDLASDDFGRPFDTPLNEPLPDDPFASPGESRLH